MRFPVGWCCSVVLFCGKNPALPQGRLLVWRSRAAKSIGQLGLKSET